MDIIGDYSRRFILLVVIGLLIVLMDLPKFKENSLRESGRSVFAGFGPVQIADIKAENGLYEVNFQQGVVSPPSCGFPPRVAILMLKPFDLNQADLESLMFIRGVGPKLAARIIARREEQGGFMEIEELLTVRGIGQEKLQDLKEGMMVCR